MHAAAWVFDVDGTIVDSLTGTSLRPGTEELLGRLRAAGSQVFLWSAGGADYARQRAAERGIELHVDGFFGKDQRDGDGRYVPAFLTSPLAAVFVDDRPEDMPMGATVLAVSPYLAHDRFDRGLARALDSLAVPTAFQAVARPMPEGASPP